MKVSAVLLAMFASGSVTMQVGVQPTSQLQKQADQARASILKRDTNPSLL
jgi:cytochrome c-type biogenesis protein CcmH/NrfF